MAITNLGDYKDHPLMTQNPGLERVLQIFSKITDCPRPSKQEAAIRAHLTDVAKEQGWEVKQDSTGNVSFAVPATPGKENVTPVILQGHMDMVTFPEDETSPRNAEIVDKGEKGEEKGLWIQSLGQRMTLGADNGIGIALAVATMTDQSIEHGPVTILLTVDEEKGMSGAKALDPNLLPETGILLNLDSEEGPEEICIGCAGSADTVASFPIGDREALPEGYTSMELDIKGFPGGHSGIAIHAGRGNAIKAIGDLLSRLQNIAGDLRIIEIKGGEKRNAIPSSAHATIAVPGNSVEGLNKVVEEFVAELKKGKEVPDPEVTGELLEKNAGKVEATLVPTESVKLVGALSADFRDRLLNVIAGTPTGPFQSAELPHVGKLVTLSNNLGKVGTTDDSVEVTSMTRGAHVEELRAKLSEVREVYTSKGAILTEAEEPTSGWVEDPGSRAVSMFAKAVEAATGKSKYMAYHAGLEAGILTEKAKELSAVATGPRIRDAHNVTERTELDSIAKQLDALRSLFKETLNEAAAVG